MVPASALEVSRSPCSFTTFSALGLLGLRAFRACWGVLRLLGFRALRAFWGFLGLLGFRVYRAFRASWGFWGLGL